MKNKKIRVGVIGGGIAGLTFVNFLQKNNNFEIEIFEKKKYKQNNLSGIQLSNNAIEVLKKLEFYQLNKKKYSIIKNINIVDYETNKIISELLLKNLNNKNKYICIDRNELINFLIKKISKTSFIHKEAVNIKNNAIVFSDHSSKQFDFIVVADGTFSKIRNKVCDKSVAHNSNMVAYKGIVRDTKNYNKQRINLYLGSKKHFVLYPINSLGDFSYTAVFASTILSGNKSYEIPVENTNHLLEISKDAHDDIKNILRSSKHVYRWPIYYHRQFFFGKENIFFIGDSAHAIVPFQAQGAAQAIEDAYCLALMFKNKIFSLNQFKNQRISRISMIASKSFNNLFIYHLSNVVLKKLRNLVIKIIINNKVFYNFILGKIYNYKFKD